jgi:hypothetical protein
VLDLGVDPSEAISESRPDYKLEVLKFFCNLLLMEAQEVVSGRGDLLDTCTFEKQSGRSWCETAIRSIKTTGGMDRQSKKIVTYVASVVLTADEFKDKLVSWKNLNYSYLQKQHKVIGKTGTVTWEGNLKLLVNAGNNTMQMNVVNGYHHLIASKIEEPEILLQSIKELCQVLNLDQRAFFSKRKLTPGSFYLSTNLKQLLPCNTRGPEETCLNLHYRQSFKNLRLKDFDNCKVVTGVDRHTGAVFVSLEQRGERSATICHFPGNYYPVSKPKNLKISTEVWFRGVRLNRLLENADWFYNYRLPALTDEDSARFFQDDVNFDVVLGQTSSDKTRIVEYLQVMDEINEEAFSINTATMPLGGTMSGLVDIDLLDGKNVEDLFKEAMEQIEPEGAFSFQAITEENKLSWAEMVEEEEEELLRESVSNNPKGGLDLENVLGTDEDGIRFVRSLGYKRKARRANFQVISQLQQGHVLKERILNMFFKSGSVTSEDRRALPNYCIWLYGNRDRIGEKLSDELERVILSELQLIMGASKRELKETLASANQSLGLAPRRLLTYVSGESEDLFSQLSKTVAYTQSRYEEESVISES